jgi:cytoskeletal protein CcmA (bactofilin family)
VADNFILLDKNTSFNGTITAGEVVVEGTVNGDINATKRILIKKSGIVKGTIQTQKLLFEEGGQHNGLIRLWSKPKVSRSITDELAEQREKEKYADKPESNKTVENQKPEQPADQKSEKTVDQESEKRKPVERLW